MIQIDEDGLPFSGVLDFASQVCPDRPTTYRDPAPPVEVSSPPPPERPDAGARLVVLAGVLGFLIGYALAVMS